MASWIAKHYSGLVLRMSSSGEKTPPPVWVLSLEPSVYIFVFELVCEVVPVCTGRYEDFVSCFEVYYGWNVVCSMWYGYLIC